MAVDARLVETVRGLLDQLLKAERLPGDGYRAVYDEVAAAVAALPREGLVAAIDKAVGAGKRRKRVSVTVLAMLADVDEVARRIEAGLHDPDPEWRSWVVQTVDIRRLVRFAESLNELIRNDPVLHVRAAAITAAGSLKSEANLPTLLAVSRDHPPELRRCLLWALKDFGREECRPFLEAAFRDAAVEKEDRVVAAWGLGKLGDRAAVRFLGDMLDDPDIRDAGGYTPGVSLRAAQALCDVHGWPFEWDTDWVETTRRRWRDGAK